MRLPKPKWFYVVVISTLLFVLTILLAMKYRKIDQTVRCAFNQEAIAVALGSYFYDGTEERLPAKDWCDVFIEALILSPECLVCPASDAIYGESSYAMNKYIAGMKCSDIPSDVVWFFETDIGLELGVRSYPITSRRHYDFVKELKDTFHGFFYDEDELVYRDRFNQYGGPGDVAIRHRVDGKSGCYMIIGGYIEFVTEDRIADLQWTVE